MRVLIAGIVGGIIMFMWGFVSHTILPLGEMGVKQIPNEEVVLSTLTQNITEHGFYFFPGMDMSKDVSEAEQEAWSEKYKAGPIGVMAFKPDGREAMSPMQLATEFAFNAIAVLLAAFVIAHVAGGYGVRLLCFTLFGLVGWASISTSYWNWYVFPTEYTVAELITEGAGWLLVGLVCAAIVKPRVSVRAV